MTNEITPAIQLDQGKPLTPEEFQKGLFDYFEDKGIMSDLRAHLRAQMIRALRDTAMGNELMSKNRDISPKLQAVNLLIAEYLLQKNYHYSLSVFITEIPLNHVFPAFSDKENFNKFKFSENEMWDILETLGFVQTTQKAKTISDTYKTNSKTSLLNCIIKTTDANHQDCDYLKQITADLRNEKLINDGTDGLDEIVLFLKESHLQPETTIKIIELLKVVIVKEMKSVHEAKMSEITAVKDKVEAEANDKLNKYKKKLCIMEGNYKKERKRLEGELENAKCNLRECAQSLQNKYKEVNAKEESLKAREKQLIHQAELLTEKEKILQKQLEEVVAERMNLKEIESRMEKKSTQHVEENLIKRVDRSQQTLDNLNLENTLLKHNVKHQQQQIGALRDQNYSYLSRIQELALKTTTLMQQLENSQQRVNELNNLQNVGVTVPVSLPNFAYRNYGIASYNGGGEEGKTITPIKGRNFKNVSFNKELKRKKAPAQVEQSSSSEDLSPTDTILKEAKERLQNLEKESDQIDKHYDDCSLNKPTVLQDFHYNLDSIRKSISKIFHCNQAGPSSAFIGASGSALKTVYKNSESFGLADNNDQLQKLFSGNVQAHANAETNTQNNNTDVKFSISEGILKEDPSNVRNVIKEHDKSDMYKIRNLIAHLPEDLRKQDLENVLNNFPVDENAASLNSSGVLLGTSFSTVEMSSDFKSDESQPKQRLPSFGGSNRRSSKVDNVALSCLFAFMLEMYLLK